MKYEYQSVLKTMIQDLIVEKRNLGFKYETMEWKLKELDQLAVKNNLDHIEITKEFAETYIKKKPNEKAVNATHRVSAIKTLSEYLIRRGYPAYVMTS